MKTIQELVTHDKHKFRNRAVAILDGKPTDESLIQDAYQLGIDIERDRSLELQAQVVAFRSVLETAQTININIKQPLWPLVVIALLFLALTAYLLHV